MEFRDTNFVYYDGKTDDIDNHNNNALPPAPLQMERLDTMIINTDPSPVDKKVDTPYLSLTQKTVSFNRTVSEYSYDHESSLDIDPPDFGIYWDFPMEDYRNDRDKQRLKNIIKNESKSILTESLMKIYSVNSLRYADVASLLVHGELWFISADHYSIWLEFEKRSKINKLIGGKHSDKRIDDKICRAIIRNLNIDYKNALNMLIIQKIEKRLKSKTKTDIKSEMLLSNIPIESDQKSLSLCSFFELDDEDDIAHIKKIMVIQCLRKDVMPQTLRDIFIDHILSGIPWINEEILDDVSLVITLKHYHYESVIQVLDKRKNEFIDAHSLQSAHCIDIVEYHENDKVANSIADTFCVHLTKKYRIKTVPRVRNDGLFAFQLISRDIKDVVITLCAVYNDNVRFEWLSYLDYVINYQLNTNFNIIPVPESNPNLHKFTYNEDNNMGIIDIEMLNNLKSNNNNNNNKQEHIEKNLNYKYETLKQELLNNIVCSISGLQYFTVFEECIHILKDDVFETRNEISINHLLAMKLYCDSSVIKHAFQKECGKYSEIEAISEIAHWLRYMKECCLFSIAARKRNKRFYVLVGDASYHSYVMFNSLRVGFKGPLSASNTMDSFSAKEQDNGIILAFSPLSTHTQYFDATFLSKHEVVLMSQSLYISDIIIYGASNKYPILAMKLLEHILTGKFIVNCSKNTENILYLLLNHYLAYKMPNTVNIHHGFDPYITALFGNIVEQMIDTNNIWLYENALRKLQNIDLMRLFYNFDTDSIGTLFRYFKLKSHQINWVKPFKRSIDRQLFNDFILLNVGQFITSNHGVYQLSSSKYITFYIKNYAKYSSYNRNTDAHDMKSRMEICLKQIPLYIESVCIQMEIFIEELSINYSIDPIWMHTHYGIDLFLSNKLKQLQSLTIKLGLKVIDIHQRSVTLSPRKVYYNKHHAHMQMKEQTNMKSALKKYQIARLIVFGVSLTVLPPKQSKIMAQVLLGSANCFNWIYAYSSSHSKSNQLLLKESVFCSIYMYLAHYLRRNPQYIGLGVTLHGIHDIVDAYLCIANKTQHHIASIDGDCVVYSVCDVIMGATTYFTWKK